MIDVQVSAHHCIYFVCFVTGLAQVFQKWQLQIGPVGNAALFVIADAGVNDHLSCWRFHHQCMNTHDQVAFFIGKMWCEPVDLLDLIPCRLGKDELRAARDLHFDDSGDLYLTYLPLVHWSASLWIRSIACANDSVRSFQFFPLVLTRSVETPASR